MCDKFILLFLSTIIYSGMEENIFIEMKVDVWPSFWCSPQNSQLERKKILFVQCLRIHYCHRDKVHKTKLWNKNNLVYFLMSTTMTFCQYVKSVYVCVVWQNINKIEREQNWWSDDAWKGQLYTQCVYKYVCSTTSSPLLSKQWQIHGRIWDIWPHDIERKRDNKTRQINEHKSTHTH